MHMATASPIAFPSATPAQRLTDSHGRVIHDLRVSITDRCNYKCVYCRTGEVGAQYPELGIDEYLRLIRLFVGLGIKRCASPAANRCCAAAWSNWSRNWRSCARSTGEPLDLALTTNGHLLDDAGRAAQGRRAEPRDGEHGRRGCADLRAHHARSRQL